MSNYLAIRNARNNQRVFFDIFWYLSVFVLSTNFLAKANILFLVVVVVGVLIAVNKKAKTRLTLEFFLITLFSITYFLTLNVYVEARIGLLFTYMIGPMVIYFVGYTISSRDDRFILMTIFMIVFGNFLHGFLNMSTYFLNHGIISSMNSRRFIPDIWTGISSTATIQTTNFTLVLGLLFYSVMLLMSDGNKKLALLLFSCISFSVLSVLVLGSRTGIILMLIVAIINIISFFALVRMKRSRILKLLISIVIITILAYLTYTNNILDIREFVESSTWYTRNSGMQLAEDPRTIAYKNIFKQFWDYPLGGYKIDIGGLNYAHNLWLDVYYAVGILPFIFLSIYFLSVIFTLIRFLKHINFSIYNKLFLLSIYSAYSLNFMVEPILEGAPFMFLEFCLINGIIKKRLDYNKNDSINMLNNYLRKGAKSHQIYPTVDIERADE